MGNVNFDSALLEEPILNNDGNLRVYLQLFKHAAHYIYAGAERTITRFAIGTIAKELNLSVRQVKYKLKTLTDAQLIFAADRTKIQWNKNDKIVLKKQKDKNQDKNQDKKCAIYILRDKPLIQSIKSAENNRTKIGTKIGTKISPSTQPNSNQKELTNSKNCPKNKEIKERTKENNRNFFIPVLKQGNKKGYKSINKNIYANKHFDTNNININSVNKLDTNNIYTNSPNGIGAALEGAPAMAVITEDGQLPKSIPAEYKDRFNSLEDYIKWKFQ